LLIIEQAHSAAIFTLETLGPELLLSGSRDHCLKLWNVGENAKLLEALDPPHLDAVTAIAHSAKHKKSLFQLII